MADGHPPTERPTVLCETHSGHEHQCQHVCRPQRKDLPAVLARVAASEWTENPDFQVLLISTRSLLSEHLRFTLPYPGDDHYVR